MLESPIAARQRPSPESVFTGLFFIFGLGYALLIPPCQVADETDHYVHAYHVSEGNHGVTMVDGWGGGAIPHSVLRLTHDFDYLPFQRRNHVLRESFTNAWSAELSPEARRSVPFVSACYTLVPYLPQAVGMAAARAAGLGPLQIFYAGRLANLSLAVFAVYGALRLMPVFKCVLGTIVLLPITVQQLASNSPDSSTIMAAFLLVAVILRLCLTEGPPNGPLIAALFPLVGWLTLCKFPYGGLVLLLAGVPAAALGGQKRRCLVVATAFAFTFSLALAMTQMKNNVPDKIMTDPEEQPRVSMTRQARFIRAHPEAYAQVCATTVALRGPTWIEQLGALGWIDTPVNPLAMHAFLLLMALVALGDRDERIPLPARVRAAALATALLTTLLIFTANYLSGDRVRSPVVHGISGRYFIPLALVVLLPLYDGTIRVQTPRPVLVGLAVGAGLAVQLVALACLVRRYYYPVETDFYLQPLALAVGMLALLGGVAIGARRAARPLKA